MYLSYESKSHQHAQATAHHDGDEAQSNDQMMKDI